MKKTLLILLVICMCLIFGSCKKMTFDEYYAMMKTSVDAYEFDGLNYSNPILGLDFKVPVSDEYEYFARSYSDTHESNPAGFKVAKSADLFSSYYTKWEDTSFFRASLYNFEYPEAPKYENHTEYAKQGKDNYVRYLSSKYHSDWKKKGDISEVEDVVFGGNTFSSYKAYDSEDKRHAYVYCINNDKDFFVFVFYNWGAEPDSDVIDYILSSVRLYDPPEK